MIRPCLAAIAIPWLLAADDGFKPILGGLPFDSGLAVGLEYRKSRLAESPFEFRAKAIGSTKKYHFLEAGLQARRLAGNLLFADARVRYRNYPEEDFWGLGAQSLRERRTTYRLEDLDFTAVFGVRPKSWLEAGFAGGLLNTNTGPGKDGDHPSIEERFTPSEAPALDDQPRYLHAGIFVRTESRDDVTDPRTGGAHEFAWTAFRDRSFGPFHFRRWEVNLRHFFRSVRRSDTFAARALFVVSEKSPGRHVPFFLQPTIGGGGDVRGYQQYRFRDENVMVFNIEHRWRVREIFQIVGFGDAGRVFHRPGEIAFTGFRGSAGMGGRIRLGDALLFGMDAAWSADGWRFWFRGGQAFR